MTTTEQHREVTAITTMIRRDAIPANRRVEGGFIKRRVYRGREQYVAGYKWCRPLAHHLSGIVYECVLANADTPEQAITRLREAVAKLQ